MSAADCIVGVFAKAPRPGEVKTRLIPLLGPEGASALHRRLLEHALHTAHSAAVGAVELWCSPGTADPGLREVAALEGTSLLDQGDGTLGERMARAFLATLPRAPCCILIGADCPSLTAPDIIAAAAALQRHDAVIAPAEDGGYVLIGLRAGREVDVARLFEGIAWSTETVIQATRERLAALGLSWHELPTRWDVDRPEDYLRLLRQMPWLAMEQEGLSS